MESLLLDAISEDDYDKNIVDKSKLFVDRCKIVLENINTYQALASGLSAMGRRFFISSGNLTE